MAKICTIYEMRYFYLTLAVFGQNKGELPNEKALPTIREALKHFKHNRSIKYNLPERHANFKQTPANLLYELKLYGLIGYIESSVPKWQLTSEGWRIYELLKNPENKILLRWEFARLMLNTFPIFRDFLEELHKVSRTQPIVIPNLPAPAKNNQNDNKSDDQIVTETVEIVAKMLQPWEQFDDKSRKSLASELSKALDKSQKAKKLRLVHNILQNEVTRWFLKRYFNDIFNNVVRYVTFKTRATFLGLANFYRQPRLGGTVEILYPVSYFSPVTEHSKSKNQKFIQLNEGFLAVAQPEPDYDNEVFLDHLKKTYTSLIGSIGYADIAELRDQVCFQLKIPDYVFDTLLDKHLHMTLSEVPPVKIYLEKSLGKPNPSLKRSPFEYQGKSFNLIRIQNS